jgi:hypothetical protein
MMMGISSEVDAKDGKSSIVWMAACGLTKRK